MQMRINVFRLSDKKHVAVYSYEVNAWLNPDEIGEVMIDTLIAVKDKTGKDPAEFRYQIVFNK